MSVNRFKYRFIRLKDQRLMQNVALPAFVLSAITFLVYFPSLQAPFLFDDMSNIVSNTDIKHIGNLKTRLFYPMPHIEASRNLPTRPLVFFTFTLNYLFGQLNPLGYHLFNLLLHILSGLMVFLITRFVLDDEESSVPFFSALIFLIHPIQTEAVAYVSNRSDELATFFCLLSFYLFLRWPNALCVLATAAASFILALASKEIAVVLPALLLLADYFFLTGRRVEKILERKRAHILFWSIAAAFIILRQVMLGRIGFMGKDLEAYWSATGYFQTQIFVVREYIELLLHPARQCIDHLPLQVRSWLDPRLLTSLPVFMMGGAVWLRVFVTSDTAPGRRGNKGGFDARVNLFLFSFAWFFIALAPTSSFFPIFDPMVERRLYLPVFGFSAGLILAWGFIKNAFDNLKLAKTATVWMIGLLVYCGGLGILTLKRNQMYAHPERLWEEAIARYPDHARAFNNLGTHYFQIRRFDKAAELFEIAATAQPGSSDYHLNLGSAYNHMGRRREAFEQFQKCIEINPGDSRAHFNIGKLFHDADEFGRAAMFYQKAIELNPRHAEPYGNLGVILFEQGQFDQAYELFLKSSELNPDFAIPYNWLGMIHQRRKNYDTAARSYQMALERMPAFPEALKNLGDLCQELSQPEQAAVFYQKSIAIDPNFSEGYDGLGQMYFASGRYDQALTNYLKVLELNPRNPIAMHNLGGVYFQLGSESMAMDYFRKAVALKPDLAQPYNDMGIIFRNQKKLKEAERHFKMSLDMDPKFILAHENLGDVYRDTQQNAKALQSYRKALALDPGRSDIAAKISRLQSPAKR